MPDLDALYENVSIIGTCKPSIDAMFITLEGSEAVAFFSSSEVSCCVRKNGVLRLRSTTLSHPDSGKSS